MTNQIYSLTKKFVIKSFADANKINSVKHLVRTVYWVKYLYPKASEELLTAAISHDIVRAFETPEYLQRFEKMKNRFINSKYLKVHQNTSAKIIKDFLTNNNIDKKSITIITKLIEKHEVGGDVYQNILKDSDSLSFFETSNKRFINMVKDGKETEERVKLKFDWMYNRITSQKAKKIAYPLYKKSINKLKII